MLLALQCGAWGASGAPLRKALECEELRPHYQIVKANQYFERVIYGDLQEWHIKRTKSGTPRLSKAAARTVSRAPARKSRWRATR